MPAVRMTESGEIGQQGFRCADILRNTKASARQRYPEQMPVV